MNKHLIAGNVGKQPEIKTAGSGMKIAEFSIAVNDYKKNKETGEKEQTTDWFNIVAFGKLAELCESYVEKGKKLLIVGKVKTRQYTGNDGLVRYYTETIADEIEFLSSKNEDHTEPTQSASVGQEDSNEDDLPF